MLYFTTWCIKKVNDTCCIQCDTIIEHIKLKSFETNDEIKHQFLLR